MKTEEMEELWEKHMDKEFLKFDLVQNKQSQCPDIHAFLLLESLAHQNRDMVSAAEHDEIYLSVEPELLSKVVTEDQIVELIRCGVRYDAHYESLCMFV